MGRRKFRLQFSLRTLLLLMLCTALPLAAWRAWVHPYRVQRAAMRAIGDAGGSYKTSPGGPAWLQSFYGESLSAGIVYAQLGERTDAEALEYLPYLHALRILRVECPTFTDDHLARLSTLSKLETVILVRTSASPDAVERLRRDRPAIAVTVRLTFEELFKAAPSSSLNTDSVRQHGVPMSVRQWTGMRVQIIGRIPGYSDGQRHWVTMTAGKMTGCELAPHPHGTRGIAIVLRSPIEPEDMVSFVETYRELAVEGILGITADLANYEASVYHLRDATLGYGP